MEAAPSTSRSRRHSAGPGANSPTTSEPPTKRPQMGLTDSDYPPLPLRNLNEVTGWIVHTLNTETTRKLPLNVDTKRSILDKVAELQNLVASIGSSYTALQARLDEARLVPQALAQRFAQALAERDATFDVRLADYINTHLHLPPITDHEIVHTNVQSYASKAGSRASRAPAKPSAAANLRPKSKSAARSKSRVKKGLEKIAASKASPTSPAFIISNTADKPASEAQANLWVEVSKLSRTPKVLTIKARNGNLILKPQDKETTDILKGLAKSRTHLLREDVPRRPRVIISNVDSSILLNDGSHLTTEPGSMHTVQPRFFYYAYFQAWPPRQRLRKLDLRGLTNPLS